MERREFLMAAGAVAAPLATRKAEVGTRNWGPDDLFRVPRSTFRVDPSQEPSLSPEVFARRLERARAELEARRLDLLIATPGTNYEYLTGYNPGRSERLIALLLPVAGRPAVVCPAFEVERIKRHSVISQLHGWEEQEDPHVLVRDTVRRLRPRSGERGGTIALESSTAYQTSLRLGRALPGWKFVDAAPVTERLRVIKSPEEVALLRRAIAITQDAMTATFAQLAVGATEVQVAQALSQEMERRGAPGGGLVQFGPSSALPHGGPAGPTLAREAVVLIDCGCRVGGYTSDITRTIWFGDHPSDEFRKVFNVVHDAQTAALELGHAGTPCQEMDRAARGIITAAGYGPFFTHRLGHGLGMDGHEPEYLVEGNKTRLEPGMVFTIEPGIYQLGTFGVRIEDDCLMTENGVEVLSQRAAKL
ncbi:MAG: aminopeptidase P family protein [Gemmatimonadetes bacterium]|nr:MAG: aminopeptidase P family protein [Gemmatimonadota bacterium]PYP46760.1 MAG: aminopeptidase P family protein [Gemmatimonadota bacterium]